MKPIKAMRPVYELVPGQQLADDQYDGMEDMLGENDHLPTDWDPEIEDPPHDAWFAKCDAEEAAETATKEAQKKQIGQEQH